MLRAARPGHTISSRKFSLYLSGMRPYLPLAALSLIFLVVWLGILLSFPPATVENIPWPHTFLPFYGPLFCSLFFGGYFWLRHARRSLWIALILCLVLWLQQQRILQWWYIPLLFSIAGGTEFLLTRY